MSYSVKISVISFVRSCITCNHKLLGVYIRYCSREKYIPVFLIELLPLLLVNVQWVEDLEVFYLRFFIKLNIVPSH